MSNETFHAPTDLGQACSLLSDLGDKALIIAGGTDLMARFNRHRRRRSDVLVYVGNLGLDYIREKDGQIVIGACAPVAHIAASPLVREKLPLLARACIEMASPAVRNAATLGGNLGTNARNADGVAALMALGAVVVTASTAGEARTPVEQFVTMSKKQKLADGGMVNQFEVPCLTGDDKWAWEKLRQRQGESRSILSVSVRARMGGAVCGRIRLVLGGMAAHPFVSKTAVQVLEGKPLSTDLVDRVAAEIIAETDAGTDARATAWYRERAARALVRQVLSQIA
ncbi:MAG: FAD binding domain-containing protein [Deltaproteobacteria bacterium]|nr:FAD binding domain-containing protein [Deltaproteobacteria bacterium]